MQLICTLPITIVQSFDPIYIVIDSMMESREGSGSVVECLTRDRGAAG